MSISEEDNKSELQKTRSWYLIFHALQFQINESPPLFMEVLREVLGDILRQNRKGFVAEPPKLSRLKCASHHHKGNISLNSPQTEQFLVCRVTSRYNHRFSDRTSIPRTKASPEILQSQFYTTGKVEITNQFKPLLQNQL